MIIAAYSYYYETEIITRPRRLFLYGGENLRPIAELTLIINISVVVMDGLGVRTRME